MGNRLAIVLAMAAAGMVALGAGACGGDDDEETTEASAEEVTVTTSDTADGYTWDVSPTPTAETTAVTLQNESGEEHALVFARLGQGYTVDEAYELEGKKGSATEVIRTTGAGAGKSATADVTEPLDPGDYVLLCPLVGKDGPHYKLGQLEEFAIE
jgi:ABC-type glycerol-3-phosphate transport system substrate-binding protein